MSESTTVSAQAELTARSELTAIHEAIATFREAIVTLSDGKWDRSDISAVISLLGGIAGLASALVLALQAAGAL